MRSVLALDVGDARIGVAVGQRGSTLAFGRGAIRRRRLADDVEAVKALAFQEAADTLVVGLPLRTDGEDSPQTRSVRRFAAALERAGCHVELEDERFTTRIGEARLRLGSTRSRRRDKGSSDEAAAIVILEGWLARHGAAR